ENRQNDVLDRTVPPNPSAPQGDASQAERPDAAVARPVSGLLGRLRTLWRRSWLPFWQFFITQSFSSLTRRIVFLNVAGLLAMCIGILYLSQFRAGLIDARAQSLLVQ